MGAFGIKEQFGGTRPFAGPTPFVYSCQCALPKLDFSLTHSKQTTSQFLIDYLNSFSIKPFTLSAVEGSYPLPQLASVPLSSPSFDSCASSTSRISNRQIPELESPVSYRKQRIGPISNRHKFAFCNFLLLLASSAPRERIGGARIGLCLRSRLSTLNLRLISNRQSPELEMGLSHRKQRSEDFLIAKFRLILHLAFNPLRSLPAVWPPVLLGFTVDFSISGVIHAPVPAQP